MVTEYTGYRATTGKSFDTEFEAWGEELRDFLVKHGADNDAIARKIVQAVVDGQPETLCTLADIVENMHRCAPPVVVAPPCTIEQLQMRKDSGVQTEPLPGADLCPKCMRLKPASENCTHCTLHN